LRNFGTLFATGEICITWDEDDWSSANRVAEQVTRLVASGKAVTGWHNILYYDIATGDCFKYFFAPGRTHQPYACGTSQAYLKSWWSGHKFPSVGVEDYAFQLEAMQNNQLDSCDAEQLCVARAHSDSQCPIGGYIGHRQFPRVDRTALPTEFFAALSANEDPAKPEEEQ
jgi:hypothetical protein